MKTSERFISDKEFFGIYEKIENPKKVSLGDFLVGFSLVLIVSGFLIHRFL